MDWVKLKSMRVVFNVFKKRMTTVLKLWRQLADSNWYGNAQVRRSTFLIECVLKQQNTHKILKKFLIEKMPRLNKEQRLRAIGMLEAGRRHSDVARHFGVSQVTISRLASRYRATGSVKDRRRSGRPRVTTRAQDRHIVTSHLRNRFLSVPSTAAATPGRTNNRISANTVRRRLAENGMKARRPYNGLKLTRHHRRNRAQWARNRVRWTRNQWNGVVFSDESRYLLERVDGRQWVYRRRGERYADACVTEVDRYGGGSVMEWGAISFHHRSRLVVVPGNLNGVRYRDEILAPVVVPLMNANRGLTLFQQDNARCHTARVCTTYLQQQRVNVLPWPAKSPDLSPIEHLWDVLDRRVRRRSPSTLQQLERFLQQEWMAIPQIEIQTLVQSIHCRCIAVRDANGGHTRYWWVCDFVLRPLCSIQKCDVIS